MAALRQPGNRIGVVLEVGGIDRKAGIHLLRRQCRHQRAKAGAAIRTECDHFCLGAQIEIAERVHGRHPIPSSCGRYRKCARSHPRDQHVCSIGFSHWGRFPAVAGRCRAK
jgi:hypothetical protein